MKQRRTLRLWQLIVLSGILTVVLVSMFFPVIHLDKEVVKNVASDVIQRVAEAVSEQDPTGILGSTLLESSGLEKELDEQLDRQLEKVNLDRSWSCLELMTAGNGPAVCLWIFYLAVVPLLILLFVVFFCRRTKYVAVLPAAVYGIAGLAGCGAAFWKTPDYLAGRIYTGVLADLVSRFGGDRTVAEKTVEEVLASLWSDMLSPGLYVMASLMLLLFVMLAVVCVTGNRKAEMRCIRGELSGAVIPIDAAPLYVGRDPQRCQLVLQDPSAGAVHFSVWYDAARGCYQIACHDVGMLYVDDRYRLVIDEGGGGPVPPGTKLWLCGDREGFQLL